MKLRSIKGQATIEIIIFTLYIGILLAGCFCTIYFTSLDTVSYHPANNLYVLGKEIKSQLVDSYAYDENITKTYVISNYVNSNVTITIYNQTFYVTDNFTIQSRRYVNEYGDLIVRATIIDHALSSDITTDYSLRLYISDEFQTNIDLGINGEIL